MRVGLLYTFVVLRYDTRVYLFACMCECTYIYHSSYSHVNMIIVLLYFMIRYTLWVQSIIEYRYNIGTRYTMYLLLLCKSDNGKPCACSICIPFVFEP